MNSNLRNTLKLIIGTVGFLAMLIAIQAVLASYNRRIDLTLQQKFTLAPRTQHVVSNLQQDVHAIAFIHPDRPENFFLTDMLGRMDSLSRHFRYTIVDINRSPATAQQYDARRYGTIVFESAGRSRHSFLHSGENDVVAALLHVTRSAEKMIYFTTGHGEGDLSDPQPEDGYTKLRGAMADEFYVAKQISLADTAGIPDDAAVVVLLGPKDPFLPFELQALDAFLKRGGALFVMTDPNSASNLDSFLEQYGVHLLNYIAVDPSKRIYAGESITFRASRTATTHDMIKAVNAPPIFSLSRVVEVRQDLDKGIIAAPILSTSGSGFGSAEQRISAQQEPQFVVGRDRRGPVPIAGEVILTNGEQQGRPGRIVVFGDVDFAHNGLLEQGGNRDLFINAVNWLADDVGQVGERATNQPAGEKQFYLTDAQGRRILIVSTAILPSSFLLIGIGVFVWRRQRG
jgi:ABC-type uncharacterized transport system involved in gliding motility auxiliary subunit